MTSRLLRALLLAAGGVVLAVVVWRIGPGVIAQLLERVRLAFVWVTALYVAHLVIRATALWRSLPTRSVRFGEAIRIRFAAEAIEMLTFTGPFLAEPATAMLLKRSGARGAEAFGAVAIEYLLYTLVSAWMALFAFAVLLARGAATGASHSVIVTVIVGMIAFSGGCVFAAVTGIGLIVPSIRLAGVFIGRDRAEMACARIEPVERVIVSFMHERPARLAEVVALEGAGHALLASEIWVICSALGLAVARSTPVVYEGAIKFIGVAFFFIPGQLGASESVYALIARTLGMPAAAGVTLALVRRLRGLLVAALGLAANTL